MGQAGQVGKNYTLSSVAVLAAFPGSLKARTLGLLVELR